MSLHLYACACVGVPNG